jgi:hypothetical protein
LQSQVTKTARKRLSLSGLEVLHGRLLRLLAHLAAAKCGAAVSADFRSPSSGFYPSPSFSIDPVSG